MLVHENPGTCGAAARLPKKPGIQKLTPPSSARAACDQTAAIDKRPMAQPRLAQSHRMPCVSRDPTFAGIGVMPVPLAGSRQLASTYHRISYCSGDAVLDEQRQSRRTDGGHLERVTGLTATNSVSPPYDFAWNVQGAARPCAAENRADIYIRCT